MTQSMSKSMAERILQGSTKGPFCGPWLGLSLVLHAGLLYLVFPPLPSRMAGNPGVHAATGTWLKIEKVSAGMGRVSSLARTPSRRATHQNEFKRLWAISREETSDQQRRYPDETGAFPSGHGSASWLQAYASWVHERVSERLREWATEEDQPVPEGELELHIRATGEMEGVQFFPHQPVRDIPHRVLGPRLEKAVSQLFPLPPMPQVIENTAQEKWDIQDLPQVLGFRIPVVWRR